MSKCKNICMAKIVTHFLPLLIFMLCRQNPLPSQHSVLLEWGLLLSKLIFFYRTPLASVSLLCAGLMFGYAWCYCKWYLVFLRQYLALNVCCLAMNFIFQHVLIFFVGGIVAGMLSDWLVFSCWHKLELKFSMKELLSQKLFSCFKNAEGRRQAVKMKQLLCGDQLCALNSLEAVKQLHW